VVEEERQSMAVALPTGRPLWPARGQPRLEAIDQAQPQVWCWGCGHQAQSPGRRMRTWGSMVGDLELTRRYRWCDRCEPGRIEAQESPLGEGPPRTMKKLTTPDTESTAARFSVLLCGLWACVVK